MPRRFWIPLYLAAGVLAPGCAGPTALFQIVPTGRGTFIIPSPDLIGASSNSTEKAKAYEDAAAYCKKRSREIETVPTSANEAGFLEIAAPEIEFRCVTPLAR
jgi:hypothetical protein